MLSEKDKKNLFGGKRGLFLLLEKQKAKKKLNTFIKSVDEILQKYSPVDFNNVFTTAFLQESRILFEEQMWSLAVNNYLIEIFGNQQSDVLMKFGSIIAPDAISDYIKTRYRLTKKREILETLVNDIENC